MSRGRGDGGFTWSAGPDPWYRFTPARQESFEPSAASTRGRADEERPPRSVRDPGFLLGIGIAAAFFFATWIEISESGPGSLILFGLVGLAGGLTAFLRPRWFPAVLVAYFPFTMRYPFAIGAGVNMTNLLLLLGPVAILSYREQSRRRYRFSAFEVLLVLFIALGFLGFLKTYFTVRDLAEALTEFKRWSTPPIFFFIVRALLDDRRDIARLVKIMAFTTASAAALTWWEAIQRGPRSSIEASRVSGIFNGPNEMGTFLVYASMMMLAVAVWRTGTGKRILYLGGFLLASRAMLFTFSRGAYVSLAGGAAIILLLRNPLYLAGAVVAGAAAVTLEPDLLPDSVVTRLAQTTRETAGAGDLEEVDLDKSVSHRFVLWRAARRMILDNPTGVGLSMFRVYVDAYVEQPLRFHDARDAHNAYLLVAAELGILALVTMVALLAILHFTCLRLYIGRRHPFDRMVALGALGSFVAITGTFMLGSRFADENFIGYFWILAAFVMVLRRFRDLPAPLRPGSVS